jgi:hypothetical protein
MSTPTHGKNGWTLEEYTLDPENSIGYFVYSRTVDGKLEVHECTRQIIMRRTAM